MTADTNALLLEAVARDRAIVARALADHRRRVTELEQWLNRLVFVHEQITSNERERRVVEAHLEDYSEWALNRVEGMMAEAMHRHDAPQDFTELVDYQSYEWVMRAHMAIQVVETRARERA